MPSQIEVVNRALIKLGEDRLISLEDDTKAARAVGMVWDTLLDSELARNRWAFSVRRAILPALLEPPAWGYSLAYQLPDDCLQLIWVDGASRSEGIQDFITDSTAPFLVEGRTILTDIEAPLQVRYVARVTDPNLWEAPFIEAFSSRLAYELAEDLTQSSSKREMAWAEYKTSVGEARRQSAIQNPPQSIPDDSWLQARY
jgi:hypothetical protein